ncbi:MAG: acyltransferase [Lutibacter sp.]
MFKPIKILADGKQSLIKIGDNTRIHGSCIHAKDKIEIGSNCLIAANCQIFDSNGHKTMLSNPIERVKSVDEPKSITIQDNVWIGAGVYILPGVTIKSGSVIAAGSVVKTDIPENVIASGNPAMVIKKLKNE